MADQVKFEQHKYEKLKAHLEQEEQEVQTYFKPQISKGTQKILKKKQESEVGKEVHERLYNVVK